MKVLEKRIHSRELHNILEMWAPCFTVKENAKNLEISYARAKHLCYTYGLNYKKMKRGRPQ